MFAAILPIIALPPLTALSFIPWVKLPSLGTGWYINYTAVNGEVETIYISVLGDLTGDGLT